MHYQTVADHSASGKLYAIVVRLTIQEPGLTLVMIIEYSRIIPMNFDHIVPTTEGNSIPSLTDKGVVLFHQIELDHLIVRSQGINLDTNDDSLDRAGIKLAIVNPRPMTSTS